MSLLFAYSSLPPQAFTSAPLITLKRFYDMLELTLSDTQKDKLSSLRGLIDIKNILSLQTGVHFDPKGNFRESGLRLALSNSEILPEYILEFLQDHKEDKDLESNFPQLYVKFFSEEIAKNSISSEFLTFERDLNLLLFGLSGKKTGIDVESYLQYEDMADPLVTHVLLQSKGTGPFIFPFEYKDLEEKIKESGGDPMKQYIAISSYRYNFYKEIVDDDAGSFRSICAYMMCLWILDEKASLDEKIGRKVLTELVENDNE